jgi:hypothetical protein|tara:strand:+ start:983 stop:1366 length:384 start_codon:yes stop_codon:yes gene_type:complete
MIDTETLEVETINTKTTTVVDHVESLYPETTELFKKIQKEQYELFCLKQSNYGPDNISLGTDLTRKEDRKMSQTGLWFRMNDKIQRLKQLIVLGNKDNVGESVVDTYQDLSVYGVICQIVKEGKWGK